MSRPTKTPRKVGVSKGTGNRGKGRKAGTPNKVPQALKEMILGALEGAGNTLTPGGGGQAYLEAQAVLNPGPFLALIGKVLPMSIKADIACSLTSRIVEVPADE